MATNQLLFKDIVEAYHSLQKARDAKTVCGILRRTDLLPDPHSRAIAFAARQSNWGSDPLVTEAVAEIDRDNNSDPDEVVNSLWREINDQDRLNQARFHAFKDLLATVYQEEEVGINKDLIHDGHLDIGMLAELLGQGATKSKAKQSLCSELYTASARPKPHTLALYEAFPFMRSFIEGELHSSLLNRFVRQSRRRWITVSIAVVLLLFVGMFLCNDIFWQLRYLRLNVSDWQKEHYSEFRELSKKFDEFEDRQAENTMKFTERFRETLRERIDDVSDSAHRRIFSLGEDIRDEARRLENLLPPKLVSGPCSLMALDGSSIVPSRPGKVAMSSKETGCWFIQKERIGLVSLYFFRDGIPNYLNYWELAYKPHLNLDRPLYWIIEQCRVPGDVGRGYARIRLASNELTMPGLYLATERNESWRLTSDRLLPETVFKISESVLQWVGDYKWSYDHRSSVNYRVDPDAVILTVKDHTGSSTHEGKLWFPRVEGGDLARIYDRFVETISKEEAQEMDSVSHNGVYRRLVRVGFVDCDPVHGGFPYVLRVEDDILRWEDASGPRLEHLMLKGFEQQ